MAAKGDRLHWAAKEDRYRRIQNKNLHILRNLNPFPTIQLLGKLTGIKRDTITYNLDVFTQGLIEHLRIEKKSLKAYLEKSQKSA